MGFITALAGFLFLCLVGGLIGGGLFLAPVFPTLDFILNYGPYLIMLSVIWLFFFMITAALMAALASSPSEISKPSDAISLFFGSVIAGMIPQLISWGLIRLFVGEGSDSLGIRHLNNMSLGIMFAVMLIYSILLSVYALFDAELRRNKKDARRPAQYGRTDASKTRDRENIRRSAQYGRIDASESTRKGTGRER